MVISTTPNPPSQGRASSRRSHPRTRPRRRRQRLSNGIRPRHDEENTDGPSESIPGFNLSRRVVAEDGRIDRLGLKCYLGTAIIDHEDDYANFRNFLRVTENRLFLSAPDGGTGKRRVKIRNSETTHEGFLFPGPLFSGALKSVKRGEFLCLSMDDLYLNPTRAIRFHSTMTTDQEGVFETAAKPTEPRTLDRKFNCLPAWITREQYRAGETRHIRNVFKELERTCREAGEMALLQSVAFRASEFCLNECEIYFEFHRPNAVETLRGLAESLSRFGEHGAKRDHAPRTEANEVETKGNGESVKLRLSKAEHVVVYAKTPSRLRFEVRIIKPNSNILKGRTSPNLTGFLPKLDTLRERAARRINEVLDYLEEAQEIPPTTVASDWRYQQRWFERLGWDEVTAGLLDSLRLQGRLFVTGPTSTEKKVIRKAKEAGLIHYVKARGCYVPRPEVVSGN
jgi:hypothetical protein